MPWALWSGAFSFIMEEYQRNRAVTTEIRTATQVSAYAWNTQKHKVDSLGSFVNTVRIEQELGTEFIGIYEDRILKGGWLLAGDKEGDCYELVRPDDAISYGYLKRMFAAI